MNNQNENFIRYVIFLNKTLKTTTEDIIRNHVLHLKKLEDSGDLVICGPFSDYDGGLLVIKANSFEDAKNIAKSDPFVLSGARTYELRTLNLSCKENNHMGFG